MAREPQYYSDGDGNFGLVPNFENVISWLIATYPQYVLSQDQGPLNRLIAAAHEIDRARAAATCVGMK